MTSLDLISLLGSLWPAAPAIAIVAVRDRRRGSRRCARLNERLHELRRPLQILALARPAHGESRLDPLELALHALRDLDREVNGEPEVANSTAIDARRLVDEAAARWRGSASRSARPLRVRWLCDSAVVEGNQTALARALDNLIANSLDHGSGPITLIATMRDGAVQIAVRDGGSLITRRRAHDRDPRHGHGLRVAGKVAARHGGSFELRRSRIGTVAALRLPIAGERSIAT